jgi:hypothetical protein
MSIGISSKEVGSVRPAIKNISLTLDVGAPQRVHDPLLPSIEPMVEVA